MNPRSIKINGKWYEVRNHKAIMGPRLVPLDTLKYNQRATHYRENGETRKW